MKGKWQRQEREREWNGVRAAQHTRQCYTHVYPSITSHKCGRFVFCSSFFMPSNDTSHTHIHARTNWIDAAFLSFRLFCFISFRHQHIYRSSFIIQAHKLRTSYFSNLCEGMFSYRHMYFSNKHSSSNTIAIANIAVAHHLRIQYINTHRKHILTCVFI